MRSVSFLFALGLLACSFSAREPTLDLGQPDRLHGIASPPGDLAITIHGGALGGDLTTEITGANAGDLAYVARTSAGLGDGPCFDAIGGACLGLVAPLELHGSIWTDEDGHGSATVSIPERADWMGRELCFQAIVRRGAGGSLSEVSDTACVTLDRDSDGDGAPDSSDPCPDDDTDACIVDEWVFGDYESTGSTTFVWTTQYNGSFSCSDTCDFYGAEATGARWVCNHWDGGTGEGCSPDNHGEWTDDHCSEQIVDGVYLEGSNPACGSESQIRGYVDGTGSEGYTWHAVECQCSGDWDEIDPGDDTEWDDVDPGAFTGSEPGWFFINYDGLSIPFDPTVQWNGTVSCGETCASYALDAVGARFVCNLHGSSPTEGCDATNDGFYGDDNCGWMVRDGVELTENGNTEDCAGGDIMGCVTGSCTEYVTYHSLECQCE